MNEWAIIGVVTTPILALFGLLYKHAQSKGRHPNSEDLVYADVCEKEGEKNDLAHQHLKEGIDNAMARSEERHRELKADMKGGFTEIKTLIQAIQ